MLFQGWDVLLRTLVVGVCGYVALIVVLRVTGKRTLSKMNAFDFVITVAFGSTFAALLTSPQVALAEGVLALALLAVLQYVVAWASVRSGRFGSLVKAQPALLLYRGQWLFDAMRRERVTREEVLAAVRAAGIASLKDAEAVVLETEGSLHAIRAVAAEADVLEDVQGSQQAKKAA